MKRFAKLFLLTVVWLSFLWLCYAQDWTDLRANPNSDYFFRWCQCWWQPVHTLFILTDLIIISLLISLLLFPLRNTFKKSGQRPRYSVIPFRNIYILIKINSSTKTKKMFIFFYALLCCLLTIWIGKHYDINPIQEYLYQIFSHGCCEWRIIVNVMFRWLPILLFGCDFLILLLQLYKLARSFGWRKLNSVLFALFFPIWVRILSFGNYEYIGNKENENNLKSK